MSNHRTWFLAEAHQERLIEKSLSQNIEKDRPTALLKTFPSTSKNNTYQTQIQHTSNTSHTSPAHINHTSPI